MTAEALVRQAMAEDLDAWAGLRRELWPRCSLEHHRLEIAQLLRGAGVVPVAIVREEMVGFAEVSLRHDHVEGASSAPVPYLEGWYVAAAYRRKGIGTAILLFVEQWARDHGYSEIASDAEIDNRESARLHVSRGFVEVARTVHFIKRLR